MDMDRINTTRRGRPRRAAALLAGLALAAACLAGCAEQSPTTAGPATFSNAGTFWPEVELQNLTKLSKTGEPYRVVKKDVLEMHIPTAMLMTVANLKEGLQHLDPAPYACRVSEAGTVTLPIIGDMTVVGKTLTEIEKEVVAAYYPRYLVKEPSVLVLVKEYDTVNASVSGAVERPGVYELKSNERSLMTLLMKSGGIIKEGARTVRVQRPGQEDLVLPVYAMRFVPADAVLQGGETVLVEQLEPMFFTVVGLVRKPGAYPYPPTAKYNLMQALAIAGGVNDVADPRYAKVFRHSANGDVLIGSFKICGKEVVDASKIEIMPGDVVALEHTARTRARLVLSEIFRIGAGFNVGAYYSPVK